MAGATGVVSATSELVRKRWLMEGLVQARSKSFWAPYTGKSSESVIHQVNNESATEGHSIVFDYDGNLAGKAKKNKDQAFGTGEQKKKFSEKLTVNRYRIPVDNGDKFDGVNIGDLSITQHMDSRTKLADLFMRWKDQAIFDTAQSFYLPTGSVAPKHGIYYDASSTKISYATLVEIEKVIRTGSLYNATSNPLGYSVRTLPNTSPVASAAMRAPLKPFMLSNGDPVWLMVLDPFTHANLLSNSTVNSGIVAMALSADVRGSNNLMFKGVVGKVGSLMIVRADSFFGDNSTGSNLEDMGVEIAGLRAYDGDNADWAGESSYANPQFSRNLILGANAVQLGFGKQPDYKYQESEDFGIKSESAVEFWMESQKTYLDAENNDDYNMAKISGLDFGVVPFDVKL